MDIALIKERKREVEKEISRILERLTIYSQCTVGGISVQHVRRTGETNPVEYIVNVNLEVE